MASGPGPRHITASLTSRSKGTSPAGGHGGGETRFGSVVAVAAVVVAVECVAGNSKAEEWGGFGGVAQEGTRWRPHGSGWDRDVVQEVGRAGGRTVRAAQGSALRRSGAGTPSSSCTSTARRTFMPASYPIPPSAGSSTRGPLPARPQLRARVWRPPQVTSRHCKVIFNTNMGHHMIQNCKVLRYE